jgi:hypothetical protein
MKLADSHANGEEWAWFNAVLILWLAQMFAMKPRAPRSFVVRKLGLAAIAAMSLFRAPTSALAADRKPDFAAKLPAQVGEWKKPAQPARYDRNTLYDYIDGGAELYLAFGFQGAIALAYAADPDDEIKVDIFDMGSPRGAFGVFAHGRESLATEVGQGSDYGGGLLTFWKHRYFVSVLGYPETEAKRKAVYHLGRAVAALIPETGAPPAIIAALPNPGLVAASVRTFHHPLLQNDYVTVSLENPLGIGPETEAVLARYVLPEQRYVLLLVDYPSEATAKNAQRGFSEKVLGGALAAKRDTRWAGIKRNGSRIVIAFDAPSRAIVEHVLSEVPWTRTTD